MLAVIISIISRSLLLIPFPVEIKAKPEKKIFFYYRTSGSPAARHALSAPPVAPRPLLFSAQRPPLPVLTTTPIDRLVGAPTRCSEPSPAAWHQLTTDRPPSFLPPRIASPADPPLFCLLDAALTALGDFPSYRYCVCWLTAISRALRASSCVQAAIWTENPFIRPALAAPITKPFH